MLLIHIPNHQHTLYTIRQRNILHFMKLIRLYLGLNIKTLLAEIPPHIIQRISLDRTRHLRIRVYIRHLIHHIRIARNRRRKINRERHKRLSSLSNSINRRYILRETSIRSSILSAHARYLKLLAVQNRRHLAQPTPFNRRLRVAVSFTLENDLFSGLGVHVLGDVGDIGRAVDAELGYFEYLAFGVGDLAFYGARVVFLDWAEHDFVDFVALFASAKTVVEGVCNTRAVADDSPGGRGRLADAP